MIPDRRQRRRQESIEEILDVALEVMAEQGVAGLSLGEVARRLGVRPPSLYGYFASKHAVYDAEFGRGAQQVQAVVAEVSERVLATATDPGEALEQVATAFIEWAIENPVYSQLLFWRPVPGFEPSPAAYQPAVDLIELSTRMFADMQERGWIRADVPAEEILRDWTILTSGIISQQLANAPTDGFQTGRFTAALPGLVAMFVASYAAATSSPKTNHNSTTGKGPRNADQR